MVCGALASLALCAAGLRSSAGPGTGLRWERRALFLSCFLPRATPGSILARSGCEAAVEHLLKTLGTAASPGCKPQRSPALSPRVPWAQQYQGVQASLLSSIHPSPGWLLWLSHLSLSCKSPAPSVSPPPSPPAALGVVPRLVQCGGRAWALQAGCGRGRGTPAHGRHWGSSGGVQ